MRKNKGITLIALIITIIVLLILSGVSIATLTGDNGIITQAIEAREQTEIAEEREQIELAYISAMGNAKLTKVIPENLQEEIEINGYENKVTSDKDENGKKGLLVNLIKKDRYYFIADDQVRVASKEEFSKEITPFYAILYSDGDLRFNTTGNVDATKTSKGETVVLKSEDISNTRLSYSADNMPWASKKADIKTVTIEEKIVLKYGSAIFDGLTNLEKINGIEKLFTDNVTAMQYMFINCSKLTELDLSGFNTSNVTAFFGMFQNCSSLTELNISSFDVSNAAKMDKMFKDCSSLEKLDLSGFKTSNKLVEISEMFSGCIKIAELDLSGLDTSNVTGMYGTFRYCENLRKLKLSDKFVCTNVTNMEWMFDECESLIELDLSSFKETKASSLTGMFRLMFNLKKLDISNLDAKNVTDMRHTFYRCKSLELLDMRSVTLNNVTTYDNAFNFENLQADREIIVKDDMAKEWVQNKLEGAGKTKVITVSELE